jgi:hypothetical protein
VSGARYPKSELRYAQVDGRLEIWRINPDGKQILLGYAEPFDEEPIAATQMPASTFFVAFC